MRGGVVDRISLRELAFIGSVAGLVALVLFVVVRPSFSSLPFWPFGDSGPLRGVRPDAAPALTANVDPARGVIALLDSGLRVTGPDLAVSIEPPPGATEMQLGFDPTFTATPWVPVASTATVSTHHVGHQMLFGRFRAGAGATPSPVSVDAVIVDPTFDAATSSELGIHAPSWVRPLSADSVVVRIEGGRLWCSPIAKC